MDEKRLKGLFGAQAGFHQRLGELEVALSMRVSKDPITALVLPYSPDALPDIAELLGMSGPVVRCETGVPTVAELEPLSFEPETGAVFVQFLPGTIHQATSGNEMLTMMEALSKFVQPQASQILLAPLRLRDRLVFQLLAQMPVRKAYFMFGAPSGSQIRLWSFEPGEAVMLVSFAHEPYLPLVHGDA